MMDQLFHVMPTVSPILYIFPRDISSNSDCTAGEILNLCRVFEKNVSITHLEILGVDAFRNMVKRKGKQPDLRVFQLIQSNNMKTQNVGCQYPHGSVG